MVESGKRLSQSSPLEAEVSANCVEYNSWRISTPSSTVSSESEAPGPEVERSSEEEREVKILHNAC